MVLLLISVPRMESAVESDLLLTRILRKLARAGKTCSG